MIDSACPQTASSILPSMVGGDATRVTRTLFAAVSLSQRHIWNERVHQTDAQESTSHGHRVYDDIERRMARARSLLCIDGRFGRPRYDAIHAHEEALSSRVAPFEDLPDAFED